MTEHHTPRRRTRGESLALRASETYARFLRVYHRHQLVGLENLREALGRHRPVILIGNHCMDAADVLMLRSAILEATGRLMPVVGHELLFFRVPGVSELTQSVGVVPSRDPRAAAAALREEGILGIYPGAGSEAGLRSYRREPYRLKWFERFGFVELALEQQATLLFVAGIGIDEMYYQTDVAVPRWAFDLVEGTYLEAYRGLRLQLGAAGLHLLPGVFPLPVKVTHHVSPALSYDQSVDVRDRRRVEATQIKLWAKCQELLDRAVAARERRSDWLDGIVREGSRMLQATGF